MAHPARKSGVRGHSKKKINRYNPNQPSYMQAHYGSSFILRMITPKK